jgi:hypothetical protein
VGFVVDKTELGQVFSDYFGFPFQFSFHLLLHTHHLGMVQVPSGLSLTPHTKELKTTKNEVLSIM